MKKYAFTLLALSFLAFPAAADHVGGDKGHEVVNITVNGLVCDFCAQALEKTFGKQASVERVKVDLTAKNIHLRFKPDQTLDDATIRTTVTDAGYTPVDITRQKL